MVSSSLQVSATFIGCYFDYICGIKKYIMPDKKKKVVQQQKDSIVTPSYKNMKMMASMRTQSGDQRKASAPTTKRDTLNYNSGFKFGLENKAPKKGFPGEGYMFRAGRWEGQNNASSVNKKTSTSQPGIISRAAGMIKDFFND
jgi:hypothetical protein